MEHEHVIDEIAQLPPEMRETLVDFTKHLFAACKAFGECPPRLTLALLFRQSLAAVLYRAGILPAHAPGSLRQRRMEDYAAAYEDALIDLALCLFEISSHAEAAGKYEPEVIRRGSRRHAPESEVVNEILRQAAFRATLGMKAARRRPSGERKRVS